MRSSYIETPYSDANPAPKLHDEVGCIEWCAHCALCGVPVLYGARCGDHYGVYPESARPNVQESGHGPDWSDWGIDHPEEGPSCRCGFNGTPGECEATRSSEREPGVSE